MIEDRKIGHGWSELTPHELRCEVGPCPAVYKTPAGKYVIVGRTLSTVEVGEALPGRVDRHETAIEIDVGFIDGMLRG